MAKRTCHAFYSFPVMFFEKNEDATMNLLVLDTSTENATIALARDFALFLGTTEESRRRHGRDLIPRIKSLLDASGLRSMDLDVVAVGIGPGSYTGLRVGITAAKTLCYASGAELISLDSLQAIGRNAPTDARRINVIADAQRGEIYLAELYRPYTASAMQPCGETEIKPLNQWLKSLEPGTFVLGPALSTPQILTRLPYGFAEPSAGRNYPIGERLIEMAREVWVNGRREDPWLLEPRYLRRSAAEVQWDLLEQSTQT